MKASLTGMMFLNSSNNVTEKEIAQLDKWLEDQDDLVWEDEQRQVRVGEQRTFLEYV